MPKRFGLGNRNCWTLECTSHIPFRMGNRNSIEAHSFETFETYKTHSARPFRKGTAFRDEDEDRKGSGGSGDGGCGGRDDEGRGSRDNEGRGGRDDESHGG